MSYVVLLIAILRFSRRLIFRRVQLFQILKYPEKGCKGKTANEKRYFKRYSCTGVHS